jgi:adenylosuccinate lyase
MATENIIVGGVTAGGDRQDLHERIRRHSQAAAARVKEHGEPNDLLDRLRADPAFKRIDLDQITDPARFVGLAREQVDAFLKEFVGPIRNCYRDRLSQPADLHV